MSSKVEELERHIETIRSSMIAVLELSEHLSQEVVRIEYRWLAEVTLDNLATLSAVVKEQENTNV